METIQINMTLKKSTKGTHVYECEDSAVPTIYVRKEAFGGETPEKIFLTIEDNSEKR